MAFVGDEMILARLTIGGGEGSQIFRTPQTASQIAARTMIPACPPTCVFQDDIYLWSHSKIFLQNKLNLMVRRLAQRNLNVNVEKKKYVHTGKETQTIQR